MKSNLSISFKYIRAIKQNFKLIEQEFFLLEYNENLNKLPELFAKNLDKM